MKWRHLLLSFCAIIPVAGVNIPLFVDNKVRNAEPVANKSPEEAAQMICTSAKAGEFPHAACIGVVGGELRTRCAAAYGSAVVEVVVDGKTEVIATPREVSSESSPGTGSPVFVGEDPTTTAIHWCGARGLAVGSSESCSSSVGELLWHALVAVHRERLFGFLAREGNEWENAVKFAWTLKRVEASRPHVEEDEDAAAAAGLDPGLEAGDKRDDGREGIRDLVEGSAAVLRLRVRLTASNDGGLAKCDARAAELLGLAEVFLGQVRSAELRLLASLACDRQGLTSSQGEQGTHAEPLQESGPENRAAVPQTLAWRLLAGLASSQRPSLTEAEAGGVLRGAVAAFARDAKVAADGWGVLFPTATGDGGGVKRAALEEAGLTRKRLPRVSLEELQAFDESEPRSTRLPAGASGEVAKALAGDLPFILTGAMGSWRHTGQQQRRGRGASEGERRVDEDVDRGWVGGSAEEKATTTRLTAGEGSSSSSSLVAQLASRWGNTTEGVEWFPEGLGSLGQFRAGSSGSSVGDALEQLERPRGFHPSSVDGSKRGAYVHWSVAEEHWEEVLNTFSKKTGETEVDDMGGGSKANRTVEIEIDVATGAVVEVPVASESSSRGNSSSGSSSDSRSGFWAPEGGGAMLPARWGRQHGAQGWMASCFRDDLPRKPGFAPEWLEVLRMFVGFSRWYVLYAGERGGGMFHHQDAHGTSAWQAQVQGAKRWHLCPPHLAPFMRGRGGVDPFAPDDEAAPLFRSPSVSGQCFDDVVGAGEMVWYPSLWWHATRTLSNPTLSLSALVVDPGSVEAVTAAYAEECPTLPPENNSHTALPPLEQKRRQEAGKADYPPELCARLAGRCFALLEEWYGSK